MQACRSTPLVAALVWTIGWWILTWTRWHWFSAFQLYTFFPLWLGFVAVFNALAWRRTGDCLALRSPATLARLFVASACFWWMFEWLDRFGRNWQYLNVEALGPAAFAAYATLCFSTVLPAVAAVQEWLMGHARLVDALAAGPRWPWISRRFCGWFSAVAGAAALLLLGARPKEFYPAIWAAPLGLALAASVLQRRSGLASEIARGDWRRAGSWMLAALICGLFWEMWNYHSLGKWVYAVPDADRWRVFEMPLFGYGGYLAFGLECLLVCGWAGHQPKYPPP